MCFLEFDLYQAIIESFWGIGTGENYLPKPRYLAISALSQRIDICVYAGHTGTVYSCTHGAPLYPCFRALVRVPSLTHAAQPPDSTWGARPIRRAQARLHASLVQACTRLASTCALLRPSARAEYQGERSTKHVGSPRSGAPARWSVQLDYLPSFSYAQP